MRTKTCAVLFLGFIAFALPQTCFGYEFHIADKIDMTVKGELTYALRVRAEHRDWDLFLREPSSGDANFEKGDLTNNLVIGRYEVQAFYSNFSLFVRGDAFYDDVFNDDRFGSEQKEHAMYNFDDSLEYFLEGRFSSFSFRVGRQVVNWGESVAPIYAVAVNTVSPFFGQRVAAAGYTARDYQVPSLMVWANYEATPTLSIEGIWNPDFEPRLGLPVVGTFQSFTDALGWGQDGSIDDRRPTGFEDQQQGGMAIRKTFPTLKYFELGLYYYHHLVRFPGLSFDLLTDAKPIATYPGIDMFGISFAQGIDALEVQIQGELAYRPNDVIQKLIGEDDLPPGISPGLKDKLVGQAIGGFKQGNTLNWVFGGSRLFSDVLDFTPWVFSLYNLFEFYGQWIIDYEESENFQKAQNQCYYYGLVSLTTADLIDNTTLSLGVSATGNLHESQRSLQRFSYTLSAKYGDRFQALVGFDMPIGAADENMGPNNMYDRDVFTFTLTWYFL
jgi:Protein of unknown function (DUF1302)